MIGFVIVSHSEPLAGAAVELAMQMVHDHRPPVRIASGAAGGLGTDAAAIANAIDALGDCEGVLIITDLGSAVLSSELALELRSSNQPVVISDGPFVEGMTAGIVRAATGGTLEEVAAEASGALRAKRGTPVPADQAPADPAPAEPAEPEPLPGASGPGRASVEGPLINPMGMHSRPAAMFVKTAERFASSIQVTNTTAGKGPVKANSMVGLLSLGASKDDVIRLEADGPDADEAVTALHQLVLDGFGELH